MSLLFDLAAKAEQLPLGHVGKKLSQLLLDREYGPCHAVENRLYKKLHPATRYLTLQEAATLCYRICNALGNTHVQKVIIRSTEVHKLSGAHYNFHTKCIHFPTHTILTITFLHELNHHLSCPYMGHGKDFCDMLETTYLAATEFLNR